VGSGTAEGSDPRLRDPSTYVLVGQWDLLRQCNARLPSRRLRHSLGPPMAPRRRSSGTVDASALGDPGFRRRDHLGSGLRDRSRLAIRLNRDRDPAVADREDDSVRPIRCRELVRDRPEMIADRLLADPKDLPDLAVRPTASHLGQHRELALGQRTRCCLPSAWLGRLPARLILGAGTRQGANSRRGVSQQAAGTEYAFLVVG